MTFFKRTNLLEKKSKLRHNERYIVGSLLVFKPSTISSEFI